MIIGVVGIGYVGYPLACEFAKRYPVIAFDIDKNKIKNYKTKNIEFTTNESQLKLCDIIIVSVPTPIYSNKKPNLSFLKNASKTIGENLKKGSIIVYESSVFPGCTEDICIPILEANSKLKYNEDFFVGYSPERVNIGDNLHQLLNIKKIVASNNLKVLNIITKLYSEIIEAGVYPVDNIKVAEAAKLIENAQRDINIAFINEMSLLLNKMNIDTRSVLDAAKTKWNFVDVKPGLVGGHCIGVDTYYLIDKSNSLNINLPLTKQARVINEDMVNIVVNNILNIIKTYNIKESDANICFLGVTFKENVDDIRNSKTIEIINKLRKRHIHIMVNDPNVKLKNYDNKTVEEIKDMDLVVITVAHNEYKHLSIDTLKSMLKDDRNLIYDINGILDKKELEKNNLYTITL